MKRKSDYQLFFILIVACIIAIAGVGFLGYTGYQPSFNSVKASEVSDQKGKSNAETVP